MSRWREWVSEKFNPAQASISTSSSANVSSTSIAAYEEAYSDIEIIHRAVEMIINACVEMPLIVEGNGPIVKVAKLLNTRPNPYENRVSMFRRAFLDFHLDGNAFFYYDGSNLYTLPANDVEIIPDKKTFISGYRYRNTSSHSDSSFFGPSPVSNKSSGIFFTTSEIIHIKNDNDASIYRGASKIKPIKKLIELYFYMINFQRQFFKNNAVPGFVLTTDNVLSKRVKERLLEAWRSTYTTIFEGARNPAILDGGLKIDSFSSINFSQLDFEGSIERIQQDMAKALGVPYVLLKSGNNANIDANQKLFYQHTILPILTQFTSAFELLPALQPDHKIQATYLATLVNSGVITPDEARGKLEMSPLESGGDSIRVPQNITGSATNPSVGGKPAK